MQAGPVQHREVPAAPSLGQRLCLDRIRQAVADVGPRPSDLTGQEALSALLAKRGYAGETATLAPLDVDLLSLPVVGNHPVPLEDLLSDRGGV
eukprot:10677243-Heterocapsa_arctica.AAC.1